MLTRLVPWIHCTHLWLLTDLLARLLLCLLAGLLAGSSPQLTWHVPLAEPLAHIIALLRTHAEGAMGEARSLLATAASAAPTAGNLFQTFDKIAE